MTGPSSRRSPTPTSGSRDVRSAPPTSDDTTTIVGHADVRRMLLTMRAYLEALRCVLYLNAESIDLANAHPDEAVRVARGELVDVLTPISKGWGTDLGVELTSLAVQVHGGMGYIEETGVAQHYRDIRIAPIYEGTNGIQAIDLVGRKLGLRDGGVIADFLAGIDATATEASVGRRRVGGARRAAWPRPTATLRAGDRVAASARCRRSRQRPRRGDAVPADGRHSSPAGGCSRGRRSPLPNCSAGDGDGFSTEFLEQKLVTARFYATQLLPAGGRPAAGDHRRRRRPVRRRLLRRLTSDRKNPDGAAAAFTGHETSCRHAVWSRRIAALVAIVPVLSSQRRSPDSMCTAIPEGVTLVVPQDNAGRLGAVGWCRATRSRPPGAVDSCHPDTRRDRVGGGGHQRRERRRVPRPRGRPGGAVGERRCRTVIRGRDRRRARRR